MTSTRRLEKVNELILRSLATTLSQKASDARLRGVSIVRVDVSPDFALARVAYSFLEGQTTQTQAQKGLDRAKPFLRRELKKLVDLRVLPELAFFYDPSIKHGDEMLKLLSNLSESL